MVDNRIAVAECLRAYAIAMRGDWSNFDGRSNRDTLMELATYLDVTDEYLNVKEWLRCQGICTNCQGHWSYDDNGDVEDPSSCWFCRSQRKGE